MASKIFGAISTQKNKPHSFKIPVQKSYPLGFVLLSLMTFVSATITYMYNAFRDRRMLSESLKLEFRMVVSHIRMLGTKSRSSATVASILNQSHLYNSFF